jgi:hypothetical protein
MKQSKKAPERIDLAAWEPGRPRGRWPRPRRPLPGLRVEGSAAGVTITMHQFFTVWEIDDAGVSLRRTLGPTRIAELRRLLARWERDSSKPKTKTTRKR